MKSTVIVGSLVLLLAKLSFAQTATPGCSPTPLANGNFESGSIKPWIASNEYLTGLPAVTVTEEAHAGTYAANLSLIYQPSDAADNHAPLINLSQNVNACGAPQQVSLWYNIQPGVHYDTSFLLQLYDSITHHVYVYKQILYNGSSTVDSLGKTYGEWNYFGPFSFTPTRNKIIFSLIVDGSYTGTQGTTTILVDDVNLAAKAS